MKRNVRVDYSGKCPSCGVYQSSKKPENVDVLCWRCEAEKGTIRSIRTIKGYESSFDEIGPIEILIETSENIIAINKKNKYQYL